MEMKAKTLLNCEIKTKNPKSTGGIDEKLMAFLGSL